MRGVVRRRPVPRKCANNEQRAGAQDGCQKHLSDNTTMPRLSDQEFTVGLIQMSCSVDPNENLEKLKWRVREAAAKGAQVICTQELFRSQYFCREENFDNFALAECIPGPSTDAVGGLAR